MKKNKKIILIAGFFLAGLLIILPEQMSALFMPEVMLSNFVKPITSFLFDTMKQLLTGIIYFGIASNLFSFSIDNSPKMLDLKNSDFVQTGLNITTSLADILLIAVFITIALGTIFNVEAINAKKHLIKFFVVALLIHFAPLFVGMSIDIGNIIMSSLVVGSGHAAFSTIMENFIGQVAVNLVAIAAAYGGGAIVSALPGGNMAAGLLMATGFLGLTAAFLPGILIQTMVMGILTGLLFSFAIFFLTRVFVIQILAVLAPLAILASVLPQTAPYFKTWFSWLIGWSVGGVLLLFLLTLGLNASGDFLPSSIDFNSGGITLGGFLFSLLSETHIKWIALAVYMITIQTLCAAAIPQISGKISDTISGGMSTAAGKLGKGFSSGKIPDPNKPSKPSGNLQGQIESNISGRIFKSPKSSKQQQSSAPPYDPSYG
jgi:hypothetical protein